MQTRHFLSLLFCLSIVGCVSAQMQTFQATVQQPAGSVVLPAADTNSAEIPSEDGLPFYSSSDVLLYLPAPANLAIAQKSGSDIDVVVLAPRLAKGRSIELIPIGLMEFSDGSQVELKIIAIPSNPSFQIIKSPSLEQLQLNYPGVIDILAIWFENAYSNRQSEFLGMKDEKEALNVLNRTQQ